jgi:glucose/arabinose dehydrogenase
MPPRHRRVALHVALACLAFGAGGAAAARPPDSPPVPEIPAPSASVFRLPRLVARPDGWVPTAPAGFRVEPFAAGLESPRSMLVLPGGDVLVAEGRTERMGDMPPAVIEALTKQGVFGPSPDRVLRLSRSAGGVTVTTALTGLNQPYGLLLLGDWLYVANTDGLVRFRYDRRKGRIDDRAEPILPLPAGEPNNHWTRNLLATRAGDRILVTVGAATNANEEGRDPPDRAAIWEVRPDGSGKRLLATGLRNPVGLDFDPATGELWTTVNERDGLGEDTPPDYLARVVDGGFYGWPWVYFGTYPDPVQAKRDPQGVARARETARVPDLALGGHSVPLGLRFLRGTAFPERYRSGAFVARRGGGSRTRYLGFDVVFVPFAAGRPTGAVEPFLGGFIADDARGEVYGRPVDLAELPDGSLLVSDDAGQAIWRVSWVGDAAR